MSRVLKAGSRNQQHEPRLLLQSQQLVENHFVTGPTTPVQHGRCGQGDEFKRWDGNKSREKKVAFYCLISTLAEFLHIHDARTEWMKAAMFS